MKKLYSKKLGGEAFALDAAQLDTLKKAGYTVPSPEEVIADAAAVKIEPPEGKRAYVRYADHRRRGGRAPRPNAEHGKRKARRQIPDRRKYAAGRHYAARGANRRERGGLGYGYQTGARVSRFAGL